MFSKITTYQKRSEKQWIDVSVTSDQALMLAMQTEDNIRFKVGDQWVYAGLKAHSYHNSKKSEKYDFRIGNHHFCNAEWIILHYGKSATKMHSTHKMQAKDLKAILADKLSAENKVFTIERMFSYDQTGRICPLNKTSVIEFTKGQALYPQKPVNSVPATSQTNIGGEIAIECYDQGLNTWINLHGYTIDSLPSAVLIAFKETFSIDLTFSTKQQKFYAKKLIAHQDIREFFARIGYKNPDAPKPEVKPEIQQAEVVTEKAVSNGAMTAEQKLNILTNGLASLLQSLQAA